MPLNLLGDFFQSTFHGDPAIVAIAPGRINLIGEHTDYNDGFVFPVAIDRYVVAAVRPTQGPTRLVSLLAGEGQTFQTAEVALGTVEGWAKYPAGMAWVLTQATGKALTNLEGVVVSNLPMGSGVSSSAAIEMAFGVAWNELSALGLGNKELALLAQKCENTFVGVNCGIMDQMASAMGRPDAAMFLDTRTLNIAYPPIPGDWSIVMCDTRRPRSLSDSAYNERRAQCEEAARMFGVAALRDANVEDLETYAGQMSETSWRRARHVITENARCIEFRDALRAGDRSRVFEVMKASHVSLRDDYEVSCHELDAMAEVCWSAPGCLGARMTGAGFGGACVALISANLEREFCVQVEERYRKSVGSEGRLLVCKAVQGAHVLAGDSQRG
ncbi:MAG: galactokinase [Fimbriimonadaceae bacterium]|nr:galactokinase [Fimbriimonadaceae bacterium]